MGNVVTITFYTAHFTQNMGFDGVAMTTISYFTLTSDQSCIMQYMHM